MCDLRKKIRNVTGSCGEGGLVWLHMLQDTPEPTIHIFLHLFPSWKKFLGIHFLFTFIFLSLPINHITIHKSCTKLYRNSFVRTNYYHLLAIPFFFPFSKPCNLKCEKCSSKLATDLTWLETETELNWTL